MIVTLHDLSLAARIADRIIVMAAGKVLADEPLAGLDPGHVLDAGDLFRRMAHDEGRGVIVTLHDLGAALRMADRVVVLAEGAILADGPPRDALTPEVLRAAYGVEARMIAGADRPVLEVLGRAP